MNLIKKWWCLNIWSFFQYLSDICIHVTSIADYEVSVWWKNQQSLLNKFNKLQNSALLKILEVFRNSSVSVMKIEAALSSTKVRFEKLCKNYALRILQMQDSHSVRQRVTLNSSFFDEINLIKLSSIICS